ncbi:MAG: putative membrane protein YkoI [Bermanella sp.]|uniref:PepSY domain-containing protein n=1 Tax=Glaciecola sp. 33A TaxID=2057807 RepID=UPI000C331DAE|nr:PepSY domain-containing protein [Glaciecola sp. 33A]PKI03149.1 peptidase M4 [Glaciecola sp. 33A]
MITLRSFFIAATLVFASQLVMAPVAMAKDKQEQQRISKSQAAQKAQRAVAGKVLKVEMRGNVYRVKIHQTSGRVVYVTVDAITGKVSK